MNCTPPNNSIPSVDDCLVQVLLESAWDQVKDQPRRTNALFVNIPHDELSKTPSYNVFIQSLRDDSILCELFPDDDACGWTRSHRPSHVAHQLINHALWEYAFESDWRLDDVRLHLSKALNDLRDLVKGKYIKARGFVGFGSSLPQGASLQTPYGKIRPWRPIDDLLLQTLVVGGSINGGGCVLETTLQQKFAVTPVIQPGEIYGISCEDERWQRITLAFVLLQTSNQPLTPIPWFALHMHPLNASPGGGELRQFRVGPEVTTAQLPELQNLLNRTTSTSLTSIAASRTVSMLSRLNNNTDAIIDGVIVWENLFAGKVAQELSYRVSINMAMVMSDDPSERVTLQGEIKKIYDLRSRVVHGGEALSSSDAFSLRNKVEVLTIRALKRLLFERSPLLGAEGKAFIAFIMENHLVNVRPN